ncbi:hypothetical protein BUALT_Bualt16G0012800 [Buddleja alternifolia]|uniref:Pheromone receptor n=1 Tax=Buddleja alternifolia TaxID=168488 RepID=A0AAV6W8D1_9LAMI|nr:hypothetical protein BUALT_Bualt16G0012800 [Buddleja alternifolia]
MNSSQYQEDAYMCPSFNSYSCDRLAETAVRVAAESSNAAVGDDDFEFTSLREDEDVSADEFAQIKPIFPVFNRDLLLGHDHGASIGENKPSDHQSSVAIPLRDLFLDDRDSCSSSSEADELESVPEGTYCVWRPKLTDSPLPNQCKKSKSTGSASKRWKLPDFLKRSNSEGQGKGNFVFLAPKSREEKPKRLIKGAAGGGLSGGAASAHEELYIRNRAIKEGGKKKSYLPYRVGFFASVNGFPHF